MPADQIENQKKYMVTLFAYDSTFGNPFWHSSALLSVFDGKRIEVRERRGYYGVPSTGAWSSFILEALKYVSGQDLDIKGNHGWITEEEIRFMDQGKGLHGKTFELTEADFNVLDAECKKRAQEQQDAVREAVEELKDRGEFVTNSKGKKIRHYDEENLSRTIYEIELRKAKERDVPSRLIAFDFSVSRSKLWLTFDGSNTCKTGILGLLETVIAAEQLEEFKKSSLPRFVSGGMEDVFLHSTGACSKHIKRSGEVVHFRNPNSSATRLFWTTPPQNVVALPGSDINELFHIENHSTVKKIVGKLQGLEWILRNAVMGEDYVARQKALVLRVVECYQAFSIIDTTLKSKPEAKSSSWYNFFSSVPKTPEQITLQKKIDAANELFVNLSTAIYDSWDLTDLRVEAIASYLPEKTQDELFGIIDYPSPSELLRM